MKFIHFINRLEKERSTKKGIQVGQSYRGNGILCYPIKRIPFKTRSTEQERIAEEEFINKTTTIEESWETIGALGFKQNHLQVTGIILELQANNWPLKVFIDLDPEIAFQFALLIDKEVTKGISTTENKSLLEIIKEIKFSNYVLESSFIVNSEDDLDLLIDLFIKAGGGIWGAHSFDCMTETNILPSQIKSIQDFSNRNLSD